MTTTPITTRKQQNYQSLLDEGVRIMTMRGYHATGIKELVDTVGVPKGSFYQYFNSKEDFGATAIAHYIAPFTQLLQQKLDQQPDDAIQALHAYFEDLIVDAENNNYEGGCLLGNLLGEIGDNDGNCYAALKVGVEDYCGQLQHVIEKAQSQGSLTSDMPSEDMANLLFCAWQGALLRMKVERSVAPLRQCVVSLLDRSFRTC